MPYAYFPVGRIVTNKKGAMWLGVLLGLVIGLVFAIAVAWYLMQSSSKVFKSNEVTARQYDQSSMQKLKDSESSIGAARVTGAVIRSGSERSRLEKINNHRASASIAQIQDASPDHSKLDEKKRSDTQETNQEPTEQNVQLRKSSAPVSALTSALRSETLNKNLAKENSSAQLPEDDRFAKTSIKTESSGGLKSASSQMYLQMGAFKSREEAVHLIERMKQGGFIAKIEKNENSRFFRVVAGPYQGHESLKLHKAKLAFSGFESIVLK